MMMCNFLAAGPSIAMLDITMDFFPGAHPGKNPRLFGAAVAKVAYFFTTTALLQGIGNFIWVPIANKYGRRPTYVFSYVIYFVRRPPVEQKREADTFRPRPSGSASSTPTAGFSPAVSSWASAQALLRPLVWSPPSPLILAAKFNPPLAPITIADIFFLHERGAVMAFYSSFLAVGVALGLIISGYAYQFPSIPTPPTLVQPN